MNESRLFLLDAYALIFRAYYALIKMPRITSSGFNTSAIFGFVNTLEELLRRENPSHIAVCFDPAGPTFRHEAYADYKGEREATPEDIKLSVPIIKEIISAYNIPILEAPGFEADDVIGTMAQRAAAEDFTVYMMTPDKDFGQLVTSRILQYKPSYRGTDFELRGPEEICARYELKECRQVIDLLALMGDKADNIPGCPGVGEKTAIKLIAEFDNVENLIASSAQIKGKLRNKVEDNAEQIVFSKFLATIRTDVPIDAKPSELIRREPDIDKLMAIFKELEFRTLIDRVNKRLKGTEPTPAPKATQPSLFDAFDEPIPFQPALQKKQVQLKEITDIEAFAAEIMGAKRVGLFSLADGDTDMTAQPVTYLVATEQAPENVYSLKASPQANELIIKLYENKDIEVITPDAKRDIVMLTNSVGPFEPINYYDVTIAHYLLQPDMRHSMPLLASAYLDISLDTYDTIAGKKGARQLKPSQIAPSVLSEWGAPYCSVLLLLKEPLQQALKKDEMEALLTDIELPLARVLADMELTGVKIDVTALDNAAAAITERLSGLEQEIYALAGEEFNVGSPAAVGVILFDKLHLSDKPKKTKTGQYSTGEEELEKVAHLSPIVGKILEYRQLKKLLNTYLTALPQTINPATGKIHTTYNQTVTATGRLSSSDPNLQNIPVREEVGREIRRAFIPSPGNLFLSADYSQIELRLVADFANDRDMIDAFAHDKDIHAITAAKIYHTDPESVTSEQRRHAKTANFGILYGISAFGLSQRLAIPRQQAKELIDNYFATFPTIHHYISQSVEQAREQGYVVTIKGRRRPLPDINSRNPTVRGYAERNAVNAPIQGAAADIIKIAMVNIYRELRSRGMQSKMIMQVHDELNFDVVPAELPQLQEIVAREMENAYQGQVRLTASIGTGPDWLSAH